MNIYYIIIGAIVLYFVNKLLKYLGSRPIIFKNISLDNKSELKIFFRILLYRGYALRGKGDGRIYFETRLNTKKKIILRKYNFRNQLGVIMYVPLYFDQLEEKINLYLKNIKFKNKVWKETRQEVEEEVIGIDIKQDMSLGVKIFLEIVDYVFNKEEKENLNMFFKNTGELNKYYDFGLNEEEVYENVRRKLDRPVSWSANLGYIIGKIISFGSR